MTVEPLDPQLSLATTGEMIAEFKKRFPGVVILLESDAALDPLLVKVGGGASRNLGMMVRAGAAMLLMVERADEDEGNN